MSKDRVSQSPLLQTKRNVRYPIMIEPTTKPGTASTKPRPGAAQPDPKNPAKTPVVDKKVPPTSGPTGRPSLNPADKTNPKNPTKVKTEGTYWVIEAK